MRLILTAATTKPPEPSKPKISPEESERLQRYIKEKKAKALEQKQKKASIEKQKKEEIKKRLLALELERKKEKV